MAKTKLNRKHTAFRAAFERMLVEAAGIAATFDNAGHRRLMSHAEEQMVDRVREFIDAVTRDREPQICDGCGRGEALIGERCDHCGEMIECAIR